MTEQRGEIQEVQLSILNAFAQDGASEEEALQRFGAWLDGQRDAIDWALRPDGPDGGE